MAPAKNEYGPIVRNPMSMISITGPALVDRARPAATIIKTLVDSDSPPNRIAARPARPRRSLSQPHRITDTPPNSGNNALVPAAAPGVIRAAWVRYIGVHKLNVSRRMVVPKESAQASQKAGLLTKGPSSSGKLPAGLALPDFAKRLSGRAVGSGSPSSSGDSRSSQQAIKIAASTAPAQQKTARHPSPAEINRPMNWRAAASPNRKLRLMIAITVP